MSKRAAKVMSMVDEPMIEAFLIDRWMTVTSVFTANKNRRYVKARVPMVLTSSSSSCGKVLVEKILVLPKTEGLTRKPA